MDWPAVIEKAGAALAGVIAALGSVAAYRASRKKPAPPRRSLPPRPPAADACPEKLAEVDAEIARLWLAIGELRDAQRLLRAEQAVARHDRQSGPPGSRR